MKKVLVTGMTAQHCSVRAHGRSASFSGLLADSMTSAGWTVDMVEPSMQWQTPDLDDYDAVLVGLAPLTSTAAHRAYGALSVLDRLGDDTRVSVLLDAPEPYKVAASLRAVLKDTSKLTKSFYIKRSEYEQACKPTEQERLLRTVDKLLNNQWPRTVYPALPWSTDEMLTKQVANTVASEKHGVCPDALIFARTVKPDSEHYPVWAATAMHTDWVLEVKHHLRQPVVPAKAHAKANDDEVVRRLSNATGTLATTYRQATPWWTTRVAQSLAVHTPVVTDWRYSVGLGESWAMLAAAVESMGRLERHELALRQRTSYIQGVPDPTVLQQKIAMAVGLDEKVGTKNG